jgi:hypothetical protein
LIGQKVVGYHIQVKKLLSSPLKAQEPAPTSLVTRPEAKQTGVQPKNE